MAYKSHLTTISTRVGSTRTKRMAMEFTKPLKENATKATGRTNYLTV
jgi:hypothetical protein